MANGTEKYMEGRAAGAAARQLHADRRASRKQAERPQISK
jgi:hypothetical protein